MWVPRFVVLSLAAGLFSACGGKSIRTIGGEAGSSSECELTECGGECVDTSNDGDHCGGCNRRCGAGESCRGGACRRPGCEPPLTLCGGECVDVRSSNTHCGRCNAGCGPDTGCSNGVCVSTCPFTRCGAACVDTSSDPSHCGGCNIACAPTSFCSGGSCQLICPMGTLCGDRCVDLAFDQQNCGFCGNACGPFAECRFGQCFDLCPTGVFCEGVCVDTTSDPTNCGGCGITCLAGQTCSFGMCGGPGCGNGVVEPGEEADPPPGPLMAVPLDPRTCRYDFSSIPQWYCNGTCGNWGGGDGCDQLDADEFCKLRMDNPRSTALSFDITVAQSAPGVCCPPPSHAPGDLGCTSLGVLATRGVGLNVSVHPSNLLSTHHSGRVITNLICTDP